MNLLALRGEDVVRDVLDDDLMATDANRSVVGAMNALRASLAIPLKISGEVSGLLTVGDKKTATNYSFGELRALRQLARELSLGLYRAQIAFGARDSPARGGVRLASLFPAPPTNIGPYHIEQLLGEGGMGLVYLGRRDGQLVAVKVLNDRARRDLKLEQRFRRECIILRQLRHPNVLELIDFDLVPEPYVATESCPLGTVFDLLRKSSQLNARAALQIVLQAARGLRAAHEMGIVHRDVKPRNLLRASEELVKVGDFGIAHWDRDPVLTTTHELLGTPGYLSPEICEGMPADWRADQYALGITLFEMLAGRRPYASPQAMEVVAMHVHAPIPDLRVEAARGIGDELAQTVARMMSKNPVDRFESYDALIEALDRCDTAERRAKAAVWA